MGLTNPALDTKNKYRPFFSLITKRCLIFLIQTPDEIFLFKNRSGTLLKRNVLGENKSLSSTPHVI